jgi:hypothetical protein
MANVYRILGQSNPAAATLTTLYTVPAANSAVVSTINICNLGTTGAVFRIACRPAGVAIANTHYIVYDTALPASDTISLTLGVTLGNTDVISVLANTASVNFTAFGSEIY